MHGKFELKRWRMKAAVLAIGLLGAGLYWLGRPMTPKKIASRAIDALERHDVHALVELADPEEISSLHVTPAAVAEILNDTLWNEPPVRNPILTHLEQTPVDQFVWKLKWESDTPETVNTSIVAIDSQTIGWKLELTNMLRAMCWRHERGIRGERTYIELARKRGLSGIRQQGGDYISIDKFDKSLRADGF